MATLEERFWSKVAKSDGCWEWTAARLTRESGQSSYGIIGWNGRSHPAHRIAWMLTNGPIPEGMWVLHHCDNQGCVRPDHLYIGTHRDNTRDAVRRHRMASGERAWNARLREVDVRAIRALAAADFATEHIGAIFGVTGRNVRHILEGRNWRSVE